MYGAIASGLGLLSNTAKQLVAKKEQSDYRGSASVNDAFFKPSVQPPSNEMGSAKPVFNPSQTATMEHVYGTLDQRAKSMPIREGSTGCCQDM
jgi:hypothetical protein